MFKFIAVFHVMEVIWMVLMDEFRLKYTCYIIPEAHSGEGDDYKVSRFQQGPFLHLLEDQRGHKNEEYTAQEDGQHSRDDTNNSGTHFPLLSAS